MKILIQNTKAYLGERLEETQCDIFIDELGLLTIKPHHESNSTLPQDLESYHLIDGSALVATPAFADLHVHFREPGFSAKETLITGQRAAIKGGVTTVCTMPNTKPPIDRPERLSTYLDTLKQKSKIQILASVAITENQAGSKITDLHTMTELGAAAYTDDGRTVMSEEILIKALEMSSITNCPVMTHSEDHEQASLYPGKPYPPEVESDIVKRDVNLLQSCGGKLHIAHLSTEGALEAVREGKQKGLKVSCEVSPHHLYFNADTLEFMTAQYKVNPPLRGEDNRKKLIKGIKDGVVDAIASDHAPHEPHTKTANYQNGSYGFIGLETMFSAVNTIAVQEDLPLVEILKRMCFNPREILNIPLNPIENGKEANLILIDLNEAWTVGGADFGSKSKNSPWLGHTLNGRVKTVILKNEILLEKGELRCLLED